MERTRIILAVIVIALVGPLTLACGEETAKVSITPDSVPIPVSDVDRTAWERYQYMRLLSEQQIKVLQLQNEAALKEEYAKLDDRFHRHYNMHLGQITVDSAGTFRPLADARVEPGTAQKKQDGFATGEAGGGH